MDKETTLTMPAMSLTRAAASLSFAGAATFVILLAVLHVIKPEIEPSWHFISEYAIGPNGWVMVLAFLVLALSYVSVFISILPQTRSFPGRIGLALLLVSAAGLIIAALFTTDPIDAGPEAMTTEGQIHNIGGTLGLAMPFAAALVTWGLARNPAWASRRRSLLLATGLAWVGFLVSFVSLGVMLSQSGGAFGPDVPVGWPNRLEIGGYSVWLMVVAWGATRLSRPGA